MQTQSFSSDMQTTPEAAIAAAKAMAGKAVPKGMISKIANVNVVDLGGMFVATAIVLLEPDPQAALEQDVKEGDGKTGSGEGEADKSSKANDVHYVAAPKTRPQNDAATAMLLQNQNAAPALDAAPPQTPIVQSMEQLPDPDHDLLNPEIPDTALGPETLGDEAVAMAEEMKAEFNDRPEDLLVISKDGISPAQHASNEAHNQRELDAEETRREAALNNAALAQDEVRPDPVT